MAKKNGNNGEQATEAAPVEQVAAVEAQPVAQPVVSESQPVEQAAPVESAPAQPVAVEAAPPVVAVSEAAPPLPPAASVLLPAANPAATAVPVAVPVSQPVAAPPVLNVAPIAPAPPPVEVPAPPAPPAPSQEQVAAALESPKAEDRQLVAQDALDRQLNNNPVVPKKHKFQVTARVDGENRAVVIQAADESEAWAIYCDAQKLPESKRSRRFARPQIVDQGEVA